MRKRQILFFMLFSLFCWILPSANAWNTAVQNQRQPSYALPSPARSASGVYTQVGNTTYGPDGTYTKIGNTVYGPDGFSATTIGNTTYVSGSYNPAAEPSAPAYPVLMNEEPKKQQNRGLPFSDPKNTASRSYTDSLGTTHTYGSDGSSSRSYTDALGTTHTYHSDGISYRSHTDPLGTTYTYGSDGTSSRSYTDALGTTHTYNSDGTSYRSYTDALGTTHTSGSDGSSYRSYTDALGNRHTYKD